MVNCVSTPEKRGEMLARLSAHLRPSTGLLFLVLPNRCVHNSLMSNKSFWTLLKAMNLGIPAISMFPSLMSTSDADGSVNVDTTRLSNSKGDIEVVAASGSVQAPPSKGSVVDISELFHKKSPKLSFFVLSHHRGSVEESLCDEKEGDSKVEKDKRDKKKPSGSKISVDAYIPPSWRSTTTTASSTLKRSEMQDDDENKVRSRNEVSRHAVSVQESQKVVGTNMYNMIQSMKFDVSRSDLLKFSGSEQATALLCDTIDGDSSSGKSLMKGRIKNKSSNVKDSSGSSKDFFTVTLPLELVHMICK